MLFIGLPDAISAPDLLPRCPDGAPAIPSALDPGRFVV